MSSLSRMLSKPIGLLLAEKRLVLGVVVAALLARLVYILFIAAPTYSTNESQIYDLIARNILGGNGFGYGPGENLSWRPPLYPYVLVGIYKTLGDSTAAVRVVQAIIGSLTCLTTYLIGKRVSGFRVGVLAAVLVAFNPILIWFTAEAISETLFALLLSLLVLCLLSQKLSSRWSGGAICGILLGLGALARPQILLFWILIPIWMMLAGYAARRIIVNTLMVLLFMGLVVMPWTVRNYVVHNDFLPISSNGGSNMLIGNNPLATGGHVEYVLTSQQESQLENLNEVQRDRMYYRWAFDFMKQNPDIVLRLAAQKIRFFWDPGVTAPGSELRYKSYYAESFPPLATLYYVYAYALLGLSVSGMALAIWKRNKPGWLLLFLMLYFTGVVVLFFSQYRFRMPLIPYDMIFAAYAAILLGTEMARRFSRPMRSLPRGKDAQPEAKQ